MADSESTPRRHLPHGMDKLPPDFHAADTRPEGARESDEYAGFFTSAEELAKAAGININLWLGIFMLLLGIFFLVWARLSPQKPPEPNLTGTDRPMIPH